VMLCLLSSISAGRGRMPQSSYAVWTSKIYFPVLLVSSRWFEVYIVLVLSYWQRGLLCLRMLSVLKSIALLMLSLEQ